MAEGAGHGNCPLKGYRILVNKLPDLAAQGSRPVPPRRRTLYTIRSLSLQWGFLVLELRAPKGAPGE